jgi:hypothetical protein
MKILDRILSLLFGALGTKGDTRPLQKQMAKNLSYERRRRNRRKQRAASSNPDPR